MDVRCEKCGTEYELEDTRVNDKGVTVKCTQCGHLFRVRRRPNTGVTTAPASPSGPKKIPELGVFKSKKEEAGSKAPAKKDSAAKATPASKSAPAPKTGAEAAKEERGQKGKAKQTQQPRWLIRKASGEIFQFKELTTLQQWIVEEKVDREDEISKSGKAWEKLGAIEELGSFFNVVDQARQARRVKAKAVRESGKHQVSSSGSSEAENKKAVPEAEEDPALASTLSPGEDSSEEGGGSGKGAEGRAKSVAPARAKDTAGEPSWVRSPGEDEEDAPTAEMKRDEDSQAYEMGSGVFQAEEKGPSELGKAMGEGGGRTAAWEKEGFRVSKKAVEPTAEISVEERDALKSSGSSAMKVLAFVAIGGLVGLGVVVGIWKWDKIVDLLAGEQDKTSDRYSHARALVMKDTNSSLDRAEELFRTVYGAKKSARARAGQAEVGALRALYREWQADALDAKADTVEKEAKAQAALKEAKGEAKGDGAAKKNGDGGKDKKASRRGGKATSAALATELPPPAEATNLRRKAAQMRGEAAVWAKGALGLAREALEIKKTPLTQRVMALALLAAKRPKAEIKKHLDAALEKRGNDPETLFVKAVLWSLDKKWEEVRRTLRQAILIHRKQSTKILYRAHYVLALALVKLEKETKARGEIQAILSTNKEHERAERLLARLNEQSRKPRQVTLASGADAGVPGGDAGEGEAESEKGGDGELSGDYDTLVRKGDRYSENGRVSEAIRAYKKALEKQSSGVEALTGLAYCYMDKSRYSKAKATFRRALSQSSAYGEALIGMAEIYKRSSNWKRALEYYQKYMRHHPGGRKSGLAQRNIDEIKDRLKKDEPRPAGKPDTGTPDAGTPAPRTPTRTIVVPPEGMSPSGTRPDAMGASPSEGGGAAPRPRGEGMSPRPRPADEGKDPRPARPARPVPRDRPRPGARSDGTSEL